MSAILSSHMKKKSNKCGKLKCKLFHQRRKLHFVKKAVIYNPISNFFFSFKSWAALKAHQQKFWTRLLQALPESTLISGP